MVSAEWSRTTKRMVVVGLVIVALLVLYVLRALLPPLLLAGVLAYILKPFVDWLERRWKLHRTLATALVFFVLLILIGIIPATVVPYVVAQVQRLNAFLQSLSADIVEFLSQPVEIFNYSFNLQDVVGDVQSAIQGLLQPFATQTVSLLFGVASSLLWLLSILVVSFYLVRDADRLRAFLDRMAPPGVADELSRLREEINQVWKSFFRGQVVLGLVVGLVVWITMSIVGLPNAGLMGLIAGLLEVIPTFGPILSTIPAALIAFTRGSTYLPLDNFWFTILVVGIYTLIQQTENAYLVPRIMGRRLNLHPAVVFIGVLAGGLLVGAIGVFLAAPILGTLRVLLLYVNAKLLGLEPFPAEEETGEFYPGEIDAIFLDLDGTLVETDDSAVEALSQRLHLIRWLLPQRDPERAARRFLMACEGPATRILGLLDRFGLDDEVLGLGRWLRRLRCVHGPRNFRPVDGIVPLLHNLSRRYLLAIVTTRSHVEAESFLNQQDIRSLFQVITGREDTWRIKPHPSPINYTAEKLGIRVERCLVVGDTTADMQAARAAGAHAVGVLCGFGRPGALERAGAELIIDATSDLSQWL